MKAAGLLKRRFGPGPASGQPRSWIAGAPLLHFLLLSACIVAAGYCYLAHQVAVSRKAAHQMLSAVADLQCREIAKWREERLGDGRTIAIEARWCLDVASLLADPTRREARSALLEWFAALREHNDGLRVVLVDRQMNVRLAIPKDQTYFGPIAASLAREAMDANRVVLSDLHRSRFSGKIHLDLAIPVCPKAAPESGVSGARDADSRPVGAIVIEVDPEKNLFPRIQEWPNPSPTSECLLVRREGEEVVFLNELRHKKGTALSLRLPMSRTTVPAVQAVLGREGVVEGVDYRDVPVLAALRGVPGTPWSVVAKTDLDEVHAFLRRQTFTTGALVIVFVVLAGLGVSLASRDRDARWLASQLAAQRENELILNSALEGIVGLDSQGTHVFVNPAACRMLGYEAGELIGKTGHSIWHYKKADGAPYPREECPICAASADGRIHHSDREVFWRKDGTSFPVEYTCTPSLEPGRPVAAVVTFRDVTERKRTDLQRQQYAAVLEGQRLAMEQLYAAAESATLAKSEFLANMSHEIRTPMTAILGYADLLAESLEDRRHLESVDIIRRNGAHLLDLINGILDLSKIEAGKFEVERTACSPSSLLAEVVSLMRVRAAANGLALNLEYVGAIPETILTDRTRLRQILINLIGNAIKFTEAGQVRVVARLVDRDSQRPKLACAIVDTGIGMTPDEVEGLFQPFHQADSSTSRKFGGTGLGLAISKRLAQMLGGDIRVTSEPGKGSTFTLTIDTGALSGVVVLDRPGEAVAASSENCPGDVPGVPPNCRILLAEDGLDNQRLIALLLKKAGTRVTLVENGLLACEEALAAHDRGEPFDVILMDMQMPVLDGYEATRRLRAEGYAGPIVALTGHAMADDRQKCLDAGCDDYASKPFDRQRLLGVVAHWTRSGILSGN